MPKFCPPLSRNDLQRLYCRSVVLQIPKDSDLWQFILDEHDSSTETQEDTILRLLRERADLSRQGL